MSAINDITIG